MTKLDDRHYDITKLAKAFSENLNWSKQVPDKSHSFFHPIDDKDFEQTDMLFLNGSVLFECDSLVDNVLTVSAQLCTDAFSRGFTPLAFVLDIAASWPEMAPSNFPWRALMPQLAKGFSAMGLPVTVGNVRAKSRNDSLSQTDSFSVMLLANRKVEFRANVVSQWPIYSVIPKGEVYDSDNERISKGEFAFLFELVRKHSLRFSSILHSPSDVLTQALLVAKRGLRIDVDQLISDALFIIPEENKNDEVVAVAQQWGFELRPCGTVELGQALTFVQNENSIYSYIIGNKYNDVKKVVDTAFESCTCLCSSWLPEQEEDDADAFRDLALSVYFHPMHLGSKGLAMVFDSTPNQVIPSINSLQNSVIARYRSISDIFGLNYHWVPLRVGLDTCHLHEYLANACRELVCSGIAPRAVVASYMSEIDAHRQACIQNFCASFGLNYQPQIYSVAQHSYCQQGMGLVVLGEPIHPDLPKGQSFKRKGDLIFIIGKSISNLSGSVFQLVSQTENVGPIPPVNLAMEKRIVDLITSLWQEKLIEMACNIGCGGLFTALTNCALAGNLGFDVTTDSELRSDSFLFSEAPGRVIVSVNNLLEASFIDMLIESDITFSILGHITKDELRIDDLSYGFVDDFKQMMVQGWNAAVRG